MDQLMDYLAKQWNIDLFVVLIVLAAGYFQKSYCQSFRLSKADKTDSAYKTLLLSLLVSVIYIFLTHHKGDAPLPLGKYFFSYFMATSLYELLAEPFRVWLVGRFGLTPPEQKPPQS